MKILIGGHGGHCCEIHVDDVGWDFGYDIQSIIGKFVLDHPEAFGVEVVEVCNDSTSAYERSYLTSLVEEGKVKMVRGAIDD
jgi:hypothetical protein